MKKILIADDDPAIRMFLMKVLNRDFHLDSIWVKNGLDCLKVLQEEEVLACFLDISMPVLDGLETLKAIRSNDKLANLPVFVITSNNSKDVIEQLLYYNVMDYILKPFEYKSLSNRLKPSIDVLIELQSRILDIKKDLLLIINAGVSAKNLITDKLDGKLNTSFVSNGVDGYESFINNAPQQILLFENISLINEIALINKLNAHMEIGIKTKLGKSFMISNKFYIYLFTEKVGIYEEYALLNNVFISNSLDEILCKIENIFV